MKTLNNHIIKIKKNRFVFITQKIVYELLVYGMCSFKDFVVFTKLRTDELFGKKCTETDETF